MTNLEDHLKPYSKAIIRLLRSPIERTVNGRTNKLWNIVVNYQHEIQQYIAVLGLELILKKEDGFAFVKQFEDSDGHTQGLIMRRRVGFEVSILLVILRQTLEVFDSNPGEFQATEKFLTHSEIKEEVELFLPEKYNRVQFLRELDGYIRKAVELGYLKEIRKHEQGEEGKYRIRRIIKEKVTLNILKDFKLKLEAYVESF